MPSNHAFATLSTDDLDAVTGGGIREATFGAMCLLTCALGDPTGEKIEQPLPRQAPGIVLVQSPPTPSGRK